jgi:tRNA dimethylallyltransferase
MESYTETGSIEHREIVRAIADCKSRSRREIEFTSQRQEGLAFRIAGDDRRQHAPGQPALGYFQAIGHDPVKAEFCTDMIGKGRETASDERRCCAIRAHCCDEAFCPGGEPDAGSGSGEHSGLGSGQQADPGGECLGEIDLAIHRPPSNFGYPRADAEDRSEFIEHLVFDDRRFEIGNEQPLAPSGDRLQQQVDRSRADNRAYYPFDRLGLVGVEKNIAGFGGRKPNRFGRDLELFANSAGEAGETLIGTGADQGQHKPHRFWSYPRSALHDKPESRPPVVIIAGPTASGKSALALAFADQIGGTIINADALQCYRDLAILTARPDAEAQARAPHRLYGFLNAAERGSVGSWRALALAEIAAAVASGSVPIVVGGTGLYLHALQYGLAPFPDIPDAIRREAATLHRALGGAVFRERLAALDPVTAVRLPAGDTQRLVRAYAVARATGMPIGAWHDRTRCATSYRFVTILLMPARDRLYAACNARFIAMLERGALAEAAALAARGLDPSLPAMKAVGLPELLSHLRGEMTLADATAAAQQATRRYAKRQMTWFRHRLHPDLVLDEQYSESLLRRSRQFIDEFLLTIRA